MYGVILFQIALIISLIRNIQLAVRARTRATDLAERKEQLVQEQKKLNDELAYVQSDYYAEKVAREELQLGKPGETVVIVPEGMISVEGKKAIADDAQVPNYLKWWKILKGDE